MKRAPAAIVAAAAGLAIIVGFRSGASSQSTLPPVATLTTGASGTPQTAVGTDQPIGSYGDIQVSVTAAGGKITSVGIAKLNVSGPQSQQIISTIVPQLQQQTLNAQSANIAGVSGATYTVQAYQASLRSALAQIAATGGPNAVLSPGNGNSGVPQPNGDD